MFRPQLNPFRYGKPVPPDRFVGRVEELRTIFARLHNGESTAVIGAPHIGKSSFLRYIGDERAWRDWLGNEEEYAFVEVDCHLLAGSYQPADFWQHVLAKIESIILDDKIRQQIEIVRRSLFGSFMLENLFKQLAQRSWRAMLLIDEFDFLLHLPHFNAPEFFGALRSISTRTDGLALVIASRMSIAEMNRRSQEINPLGSPFFNNLTEVRLKPLRLAEVDRLTDQSLNGTGIVFSQDDLAYIIRMTGRQPFLVQIAAAALFDACIQDKTEKDRCLEIDRCLRERATAHFEDTWRHLNIDAQHVLSFLAQSELREQSNGDLVRLEQHDPELRRLADSELIERTDEPYCAIWRGDHWRISARSFAEWIVNDTHAGSQDVRVATQPIDRTKLRQMLSDYFNEGELRDLCFDLQIDYEKLPGSEIASKARELVMYCERSSRLPELVATVRRLRPNALW